MLPHYLRPHSENDITDVLDNTFSTEEDRFGEMIEIPLIPGGEQVEVTEANKKDYVMCVPPPAAIPSEAGRPSDMPPLTTLRFRQGHD